jgi:hypothetical protein
LQELLGYPDEVRWIRYARKNITHLFPYLPLQPGYNKRLRALAAQLKYIIRLLVTETDLWRHPVAGVSHALGLPNPRLRQDY